MPLVDPRAFLKSLEAELVNLSHSQQLAFGALCCERHLPDYLRFNVATNWGDANVLKKAIKLAWRIVASEQRIDRNDLSTLLTSCVEATPDSDDFPLTVSDYAQDSATMVCLLIRYIEDGKSSSIVQIAARARDLIDARVQIERQLRPSDPDLEVKIASDPQMIAELSAQSSDLKTVADMNQLQAITQSRTQFQS